MFVIPFKEVLETLQQRTTHTTPTHPSLYKLWTRAQASDEDPLFIHLTHCAACQQRCDALDGVYPLAAAAHAGLPPIVRWTTVDKRYRLTLRRLAHQPLQALLTVESTLPAGRTLRVEDARGHEILRGAVDRTGQVARLITDITTVALDALVVEEMQAV